MLVSALLTPPPLSLPLSPLRFVDNEMTGENISPCLTPTPGRRRLHQSNCGGGRRRLHSSTSVGFHPHFNIAPEMNATAGNVTKLANDTIGLEE